MEAGLAISYMFWGLSDGAVLFFYFSNFIFLLSRAGLFFNSLFFYSGGAKSKKDIFLTSMRLPPAGWKYGVKYQVRILNSIHPI